MHTFLVCIAIHVLLSISCLSQGLHWEATRLSGRLNGILRVDDSTAVAYGISGMILTTTDAGNSWNQTERMPELSFYHGCVGTEKVLVADSIGNCYMSENKGKDWHRVATKLTQGSTAISSPCFEDDTTLWYCDSNGVLYNYDILEKKAKIVLADSSKRVLTVYFNKSGVGYYATPDSLYISLDKGLTWLADAPLKIETENIRFLRYIPNVSSDGIDLLCYGERSSFVLRQKAVHGTIDRAYIPSPEAMFMIDENSCIMIPSNSFYPTKIDSLFEQEQTYIDSKIDIDLSTVPGTVINGIVALNSTNMIAVGMDKTILVSNDGGKNWKVRSHIYDGQQRFGKSVSLFTCDFQNEKYGACFGANFQFSRTEDGGCTWIASPYAKKSYFSGVRSRDIKVANNNDIYVRTGGLAMLYSSNNGSWWSLRKSTDDTDTNRIPLAFNDYSGSLNDLNRSYWFGLRNEILEVLDSGRVWVEHPPIAKAISANEDTTASIDQSIENMEQIQDSSLVLSLRYTISYPLDTNKKSSRKLYILRSDDHFRHIDTIDVIDPKSPTLYALSVNFWKINKQGVGFGRIYPPRMGSNLIRTNDGWRSYEVVLPKDIDLVSSTDPELLSISSAFIDDSGKGVIAGKNILQITNDNGKTWQSIKPPLFGTDWSWSRCAFDTPTSLIVIGSRTDALFPGLYRLDIVKDGETKVENQVDVISSKSNEVFWVTELRPVPFSNNLSFRIDRTTDVNPDALKVRIIDITGVEIADLSSLANTHGMYSTNVSWNVPVGLCDGVYFLVVSSENTKICLPVIKN